jgi:Domain of unknown function DUF29
MAARIDELYEQDFYVWTQRQAEALRRLAKAHPNVELDFPHLIEEVADLGASQRDAVRSQLRRIIEHCLKLEYSPARGPRIGWHETIIDARILLEDKLTRTLHRGVQRQLPKLYDQARRAAQGSLRLYGEAEAAEALPDVCPYRLADLLQHGWYPENRHGLRESL